MKSTWDSMAFPWDKEYQTDLPTLGSHSTNYNTGLNNTCLEEMIQEGQSCRIKHFENRAALNTGTLSTETKRMNSSHCFVWAVISRSYGVVLVMIFWVAVLKLCKWGCWWANCKHSHLNSVLGIFLSPTFLIKAWIISPTTFSLRKPMIDKCCRCKSENTHNFVNQIHAELSLQ